MKLLDTIAAVGTPYGKGGVAMIRISGGNALVLLFTVIPTAQVAEGFVGKGLAEGVTIVSVIAGEGVDYGIALGLEHQQVAVLGHGLLEGSGGAVGGDAQQLDGRLDRRVDP